MIAHVVPTTPVPAERSQAASTKQSESAFLLVLAAIALVLLVASVAFAPMAEPDTFNAAAQWIVGP